MKKTNVPSKTLRYQEILLSKREEIASQIRNHRFGEALAAPELPEDPDEREIELRRFESDAAVLADIRSALQRISEGAYGLCEDCGEPVPAKRLEALPWARRCVSCQESAERDAREEADSRLDYAFPRQRELSRLRAA